MSGISLLLRRTLLLLASAIVALSLAAGCGGGGGTSSGDIQPTTRSVTVSLDWPARNRDVPTYAQSIKLTLGTLGARVVNRPAGDAASQASVVFDSTPVGAYTLEVQAYTQADAQGVVAATATINVVVDGASANDPVINVSSALQSVVSAVVIDGMPLAASVGTNKQLTGHAIDRSNNVLLLPGDALSWSLVSGTAGTVDSGGLFTPTQEGTARVKLTESASGRAAEADVAVTQPGEVTVTLTADKASVASGEAVVLTWTSTNATSLSSSFGQTALNGQLTVHPTATTTFTVTAQGLNGPKTASVTVTVTGKAWFVYCATEAGVPRIYKLNIDGTGRSLLATPGMAECPAVSADGGKVAYAQADAGIYQVQIMNLDGSGNVAITPATHDCTHPSFSLDGAKVLYTSYETGLPQIVVANVDGTGATQLTHETDGASNGRFSPDGTKVVYTAGGMNEDVCVINVDGSGRTKLTTDTANDNSPAFSPDGNTIVFIREFASGALNVGQVMTMPASGGTATRVSNSLLAEHNPCFNGDGTAILFAREDALGTTCSIFRVATSGGTAVAITSDALFNDWPRTPGR